MYQRQQTYSTIVFSSTLRATLSAPDVLSIRILPFVPCSQTPNRASSIKVRHTTPYTPCTLHLLFQLMDKRLDPSDLEMTT